MFTLGTQVGITDSGNGTIARSSANATVTLLDWLGPIAPGGVSKDFGFCTNKAAGTANLPSSVSVT
ncbi:MAG: cellulose binding domain-containing protein [Acidimicrobiales bacterium]